MYWNLDKWMWNSNQDFYWDVKVQKTKTNDKQKFYIKYDIFLFLFYWCSTVKNIIFPDNSVKFNAVFTEI